MANNIIIAMDSLKEGAVRVYSGMIAVFPQFAQEEALNISELAPKSVHSYHYAFPSFRRFL